MATSKLVEKVNLSLTQARKAAVTGNMDSSLAESVLAGLRCPACHAFFIPERSRLVCSEGHEVPIVRGIPEFCQV